MTTSSNDGEALTAMRKANELLASAGWDWDKLISGKIRIVEDPFKNLGNPSAARPHTHTNGTTPPASGIPPSAPPRPAPRPPKWPLGIQPNRFAAFCYCCGTEVVANVGVIFRPNQFHPSAPNDWKVSCVKCNLTATVMTYAAPRQRPAKGKRHVGDLA
jgi:hypothetical protein